MIGLESLSLQGLPIEKLLLTRESQSDLQDLAGNAMSSTVIGAAMLAGIIIGFKAFPHGKSWDPSKNNTVDNVAGHIRNSTQLLKSNLDLASYKSSAISDVIDLAELSSRRCICEGRNSMTPNPLQRCEECGHGTCAECGGNPKHVYKPLPKEFVSRRITPGHFENQLKDALPMRMQLGGVSIAALTTLRDESTIKVSDEDWHIFTEGVQKALGAELRYHSVKRAQTWTVEFDSPTARLELDLNPLQPEWRAYAKPAKSLPGNSRARQLLNKPFARMRPASKSVSKDLIAGNWEFCFPRDHTFKISMKGQGETVKSWEARLGLTESRFADKRVWSELNITTEDDADSYLDTDISGVYKLLPDCGTSSGCLHKRVGKKDDIPLFLFLDPGRYQDMSRDYFVFSTDVKRTNYNETRQIVARVNPSWRPVAFEGTKKVSCVLEGQWVPSSKLKITPVVSSSVANHSYPGPGFKIDFSTDSCAAALTIIACKVPLSQGENFGSKVGEWFEINRANERTIFSQVSWITERVRSINGLETWQYLAPHSSSLHESCERCAPKYPRVRWRLQKNKLIPYEDPQDAGPFERALKNRPEAFITQIRIDDDSVGNLRIGLNIPTLIHRALSKLPKNGVDTKVSWRLHTDYIAPAYPKYPTFTLSSNKNSAFSDQPPHFKYDLRKEQLRSLTWMKNQESEDAPPFIEEEVEESLLPQLGWRAEGRATTNVDIKGGVLADQVGYGKTATTLALIDSQFSAGKQKVDPAMEGKIHVKATLLICPNTLVEQWTREIGKFLGSKYKVISLKNINMMKSLTIASIMQADIIVCTWTLLTGENYLLKVADFAALPEMPAATGRSFDAWYKKALENIREHVDELRGGGAAELEQILAAKLQFAEEDEEMTSYVPSKRLKGTAYRLAEEAKEAKAKAAKIGLKRKAGDSVEEDDESEDVYVAPKKAAKPPAAKKGAVDPFGLRNSAVRKDWKQLKSPLFQMFHFNRVVIDEFTYVKGQSHTCITSMASTYRWVLSGTPPLGDFADVKTIAVFLGINLGVDDDSVGAIKGGNIKLLQRDRTAVEAFRSFRQTLSPAWHEHRQAIAQRFLDQFVRQNIAEIGAFTVFDKTHVIALPAAERAIYNELFHTLQAQDMRIKKGKAKAESDREKRLNELLGGSKSAEEALLKRCSHFTLDDLNDKTGNNAGQACQVILKQRENQFEDLTVDLREKLKHAVWLKRQVGDVDIHWSKLRASIMSNSTWGDAEATVGLGLLIQEAEANYSKKHESLFYRDPDPNADKKAKQAAKEAEKKRKTAAKQARKRKKPVDSDDEASAADTDDDDDEIYIADSRAPRLHKTGDLKDALRNLVTVLRRLVREYVGRQRGMRYFKSTRDLQLAQVNGIGTGKWKCHMCNRTNVPILQLSLIGSCGHIGCDSCITAAIKAGHGDTCIITGCAYQARLNAADKATELGEEDASARTGKHYGKKLESLVHLIKKEIPEDDQVLLFVQFEDLLEKCENILSDKGISYHAISKKSGKKASEMMTDFQVNEGSERKKVLILNVADESASGA
jgi:SNF2-related domain